MATDKLAMAFLLTASDDARGAVSGGYWHARAALVTIHPDGTPRNITGYAGEGTLGLEYLTVSAQCDADSSRSYGWHVEYRDVYSADSTRVQAMAVVMRRIDARLAKLTSTLGYPDTFGAYLARVASILGATFMVKTRDGGNSWYSSSEYAILAAPSAIDWLTRAESDYVNAHHGAAQTA